MYFNTKIVQDYNLGFATEEQITAKFPEIDYREGYRKSYRDGVCFGGINIISNGQKAIIDDTDSSSMVVGATGSKKTRNIVMPYVYSCALAGNSMVIHDPKGDIYKTMSNTLKRLGYKIRVLDFREPEYGDRYNPLQPAARLYRAGDVSRAKEMIMNFFNTIFESVRNEKDPFWHQTAAAYAAGLAMTLCDGPFKSSAVSLDNVCTLHFQGEQTDSYRSGGPNLKKYFDLKEDAEKIWRLIYPVTMSAKETKGSLQSTFTSCLNVFVQNEAVIDQTSGNSTFQAEDLVKKNTAVFIISRDEGDVYEHLVSAIIDQLYAELVSCAEKQGGCLKRKVRFILDEFGNMAKINHIEKKISLSRSRGISFLLVCQSMQQLNLVYGPEVAPIVVGNATNLVYLSSPDLNLLRHISALCGEREDEYLERKVPLCSVEMLRHLSSGECLMLLNRMQPFITHLPDISEYYGIEAMEKVKVKKRSKQFLPPLHFEKVIAGLEEEAGRKKVSRIQETLEKKYMEQREADEKDTYKKGISLMDNVICGMKGEKKDGTA